MSRKEMSQIIADAKKRRAKLLAEFEASGMTLVKFGKKHKLTGERMGQLINKAKNE